MTETLMQPGQELIVSGNARIEMGAALNQHVVAKENAARGMDQLRQEDTMQRILALASTREGLAALIEAQNK